MGIKFEDVLMDALLVRNGGITDPLGINDPLGLMGESKAKKKKKKRENPGYYTGEPEGGYDSLDSGGLMASMMGQSQQQAPSRSGKLGGLLG